MISNTIAYVVSRQLQRVPLFDAIARQEGTDLPSMEEEREVEEGSVQRAMRAAEGVTLAGDQSVDAGVARAGELASDFFLVPIGAGVWGGLSRADLAAAQRSSAGVRPVTAYAVPIEKPYLYPDQSIESALRVLRQRPFVPVIHRADARRLVGMLALEDVLDMYRAEEAAAALDD
jgi:CIC family chloride channel protein